MKLDAWFYELFRRFPDQLLRLADLPLDGRWRLESVTVKTTEKRIDGLLLRVDQPGLEVFVELQCYPDPRFYWRMFRELFAWNESREDSPRPFCALAIFLDASLDPGDPPVMPEPPSQLRRIYLEERLNAALTTGPLVVFGPLLTPDVAAVRREAPGWRATLKALNLPESEVIFLKDMLATLVTGRFRNLSREEIETMLQLTPLKETRAGQEILEEGRQEGRQEGERIGQIKLLESLLGLPQTATTQLAALSLPDLDARVAELQRALNARR